MKDSVKRILVVEDDENLRCAVTDALSDKGYKVSDYANGIEALRDLENFDPDLILSDVNMEPINGHDFMLSAQKIREDIPVILMTAYGTIEHAVTAMKAGASDYLVKPFESDMLIAKINKHIRSCSDDGAGEMITNDPSMLELAKLARKVAKTNATLMISGESGTGKEVLSRYIHQQSDRKTKPFVAINCAAIPDNMLEATLFGYEKGAFTGAYQSCPGKFEIANEGTLLLDEITEMDLSLQAKLLRVLQEREVERLGSKKVTRLDVRVIATTNRDMRLEVEKGNFREDLYYRLNVFPLKIPSLRERKSDICTIAIALMKKWSHLSESPVSEISEDAKKVLDSHSWPGNVRELENVIQRAIILSDGPVIETDHVLFDDDVSLDPQPEKYSVEENTRINIKENEYKLIEDVLESVNWSRKQAASQLGISERTLRYKLSKMRESGYEVKPCQ